jgi:hypothetical protein
MNVNELRRFTRNGFRPFKLYLTDGRVFDVPHPEFIAFSDIMVLVIDSEGLGEMIDPDHIVSAKPMKAKTAK